MLRPSIIWLHRWTGLAIALFLVITGLTGTVLAYYDEIERALNPKLRIVEPRGQALPWERLAAIAEERHPEAVIEAIDLERKP